MALATLAQRLQVYAYSDATPDSGVDNATYSYQLTAWGRFVPGKTKDSTIAATARFEATAAVIFRDSVPVADGSVIVDPSFSEPWRVIGHEHLWQQRLTRYDVERCPQFTLTNPAAGVSP